jgi:hypothetical protein
MASSNDPFKTSGNKPREAPVAPPLDWGPARQTQPPRERPMRSPPRPEDPADPSKTTNPGPPIPAHLHPEECARHAADIDCMHREAMEIARRR